MAVKIFGNMKRYSVKFTGCNRRGDYWLSAEIKQKYFAVRRNTECKKGLQRNFAFRIPHSGFSKR